MTKRPDFLLVRRDDLRDGFGRLAFERQEIACEVFQLGCNLFGGRVFEDPAACEKTGHSSGDEFGISKEVDASTQ